MKDTQLSAPNFSHRVRGAVKTLRREWRLSAGIFVALMIIVAVGLTIAPRTYRSEAQLFVRVGRESVALDPTATTGKTISVYESRENEINSVVDVLGSRAVATAIVKRIGADKILNETVDADDPRAMEKAVKAILENVGIHRNRKSNVITLDCKAGSPDLARLVLATMLECFKTEHLRINRTAESLSFFEKQERDSRARLIKIREELRDLKNKFAITTIENKRKSIQDKLTSLETEMLTTKAAFATAKAKIAALEKQLDNLPKTLLTQSVKGAPNSAHDRVRAQLNQLTIQRQDLMTRLGEEHPLVKAIDEQIERATELLNVSADDPAQETTAMHPARQPLEIQLISQKAERETLSAQVEARATQREELVQELRDLNSQEGRLELLEEQVSLAASTHKTYAEKLEQARVETALAEERISNINIVQQPTYVTKPIKPSKRLVVVIGAFFAFLTAIGFPLLRNAWQSFWTEPEEVEVPNGN